MSMPRAPAIRPTRAPWWALGGALLPAVLLGVVYAWWLARGKPSGGDVLWYAVLGIVPAIVVGTMTFVVALAACVRAGRAGRLHATGKALLSLAAVAVFGWLALAGPIVLREFGR